MTGRTVAIAGASGVIGAAAVEAFAREGWQVVALSRRRPVTEEGIDFRHLAVDLADRDACNQAVAAMGPVSHLVYAAVAEKPGLAAGWTDPETIALNRRMFENLAAPLAEAGNLAWAGLLQGTKAYGAHLHPIALPARENAPRDPHANFYFEQEDCLRALAAGHGFGWTILRPQVVFGSAPGAAMNPVAALGAYAALCRELGLPFAYPGASATIWEVADAALIAEALLWAVSAPAARCETFNLTNGDVFVLEHDWPCLADALGLEASGTFTGTLADFFGRENVRAAWRRLAGRERLAIAELDVLLGQSHHYVDMLLADRGARPHSLPVLVSAVKIRQAGFAACRDSLESLIHWLRRMAGLRLLPEGLAKDA